MLPGKSEATATGNMHTKFGEVRTCIPETITDRITDLHPYNPVPVLGVE